SQAGFATASGAVTVTEAAHQANAAISGGATVDADIILIQGVSNASLNSFSGGFAGASFVAGGLMVAESVAGPSARAEATGTITANQLDVLATAIRTPMANSVFEEVASINAEALFVGELAAGVTGAFIGTGADITVTGGTVNVIATSTDLVEVVAADAEIATQNI